MIPAPFDYVAPTSVEDALSALDILSPRRIADLLWISSLAVTEIVGGATSGY